MEEFWEAMDAHYLRAEALRIKDFNSLKQKSGESIREFADRVRRGAYELGKRDGELRVAFLEGLAGPTEFLHLVDTSSGLYHSLSTLADAVENHWEDYQRRVGKGRSRVGFKGVGSGAARGGSAARGGGTTGGAAARGGA